MLLLALDRTVEYVSAALSVTPPTLRKHYFRELRSRAEARARVEAKLLGALMAEVDAGNVSAIDKYLKRLDKHDLTRMADQRGRGDAPKQEKRGKKEQQHQEATEVGGIFAPPPGPGRLN